MFTVFNVSKLMFHAEMIYVFSATRVNCLYFIKKFICNIFGRWWLTGRVFKPQHCQLATVEPLSVTFNPICSSGTVTWVLPGTKFFLCCKDHVTHN